MGPLGRHPDRDGRPSASRSRRLRPRVATDLICFAIVDTSRRTALRSCSTSRTRSFADAPAPSHACTFDRSIPTRQKPPSSPETPMANVLPLDDALEISALPAPINQRAFRRPLGSMSKTAATRLHRGDARLRAFVLSCRRLSAIRQAVPIYGKGSLNDKGRSVLKAARDTAARCKARCTSVVRHHTSQLQGAV